MNEKTDIGLIGLAVMGENLALNMLSKGLSVSVYNRTTEKVDAFVEGRAAGKAVRGAHSLEELVSQLKLPRKVMIMVRAGQPVDETIEGLIPLLDEGDIIIDGGNTHYPDTERRTKYLQTKGLLYVGTGVSGGEEGALKGPSMMPGGSPEAWPSLKPIFQSIAAKTDDGSPCCDWVGQGGAGHFVKMVHNGIEYGDMQLIAEIYQIMRDGLGYSNERMYEAFAAWNKGKLESYLIEITSDILAFQDGEGKYVIDQILDKAGQKGTGKWTGQEALEEGSPLTLVVEAVFARSLSSFKALRVKASENLEGPAPQNAGLQLELEDLKNALYAAKIISYAQGFMLMASSAATHNWDLDFGKIALMWRGGCIIRSVFLDKIKDAYERDAQLENLLLDGYFKNELAEAQASLRKVSSAAQMAGIPVPCLSSALSFYDGLRAANLPANMIQAQRDYFGAHTYQRIDDPEGKAFHTNWTGEGGDTAAGVYSV